MDILKSLIRKQNQNRFLKRETKKILFEQSKSVCSASFFPHVKTTNYLANVVKQKPSVNSVKKNNNSFGVFIPCNSWSMFKPNFINLMNLDFSQKVFIDKKFKNVKAFGSLSAATKKNDNENKNSKMNHLETVGIMFDIDDNPGKLGKLLSVFEDFRINLTRIENRPKPNTTNKQTITLHFQKKEDDETMTAFYSSLQKHLENTSFAKIDAPTVPWFPLHISDLDNVSMQLLMAGSELTSDHPGFGDPVYLKRRAEIVSKAPSYKYGDKMPYIDYTDQETETWSIVYNKLKSLHDRCACQEYIEGFRKLEDEGIFSPNRIPQLQEINEFLLEQTGFRLRPVGGLISGRDFLNSLAFRTMFSTQYIRHHKFPFYTPEPDICHELLGHVPLLAHPKGAELSNLIGLASLGVNDRQLQWLQYCYWYSVEFGLLKDKKNQYKAYGTGLVSSFGELQHATQNNPEIKYMDWDPFVASTTDYPITTYQPILFVAESLDEVQSRFLDFCSNLVKPFNVIYDPHTKKISTDVKIKMSPPPKKFCPNKKLDFQQEKN